MLAAFGEAAEEDLRREEQGQLINVPGHTRGSYDVGGRNSPIATLCVPPGVDKFHKRFGITKIDS